MIDILINLTNDLKTCLAIALGTGVIFGYLYTKLKARELYKPEVDRLVQKIASQEIETDSFSTQINTIGTQVQENENELENGNDTIKKFKNNISDLKANKIELETKNTDLKKRYLKLESTHTNENQEIKSLKNTLGVEDLTKIETYKEALKIDIDKMSTTYKQKCDSYDGLFNEEKELKTEKSTLTSQLSSLVASFDKKKHELANLTETTQDLRTKLQKEYDDMIQSKEENLAKIENYKQQLLTLKNKLSS